MPTEQLAVIVSSFDGMDDLWEPFWTLFFRFWPNCPYQGYLIANTKQFHRREVRTIRVGDDRGWARNLRLALESLPNQHILYLQEDYLMNAPANSARIERLAEIHRAGGAICTYLYPRYQCRTPYPLGEGVDVVDMNLPFRVSLQAAIWDKAALLTLLRDDESQWQFEYRASKEARGLILTDRSKMTDPSSWALPYFVTAVVRGKWVPGALKLCRGHGINVDRSRRGIHRLWKVRRIGAHLKWYFKFGWIPRAPESKKHPLQFAGAASSNRDRSPYREQSRPMF
jgi:hypothetical protein